MCSRAEGFNSLFAVSNSMTQCSSSVQLRRLLFPCLRAVMSRIALVTTSPLSAASGLVVTSTEIPGRLVQAAKA